MYRVQYNRTMRVWLVTNIVTGRIVRSSEDRSSADACVKLLENGFIAESELTGAPTK